MSTENSGTPDNSGTPSNAPNPDQGTGSNSPDPSKAPPTAAENAAAKAAADKAAADKAAADKAAADKKSAEGNTVPEKYDFKAPEGVELDGEIVNEFSSVAKELKLPQAAADKVYQVGVKFAQKREAALHEHIKTTVEGWAKEAEKDAEFGGEKLRENLGLANKAMMALGGEKLKALLASTGMGNHPEVIRAFYRAGKLISEDKLVMPKDQRPPASATSGGMPVFSYANSKHN